ncbi:hypothetical protein QEN19_003968 [Hanseniaspora menglaensis]
MKLDIFGARLALGLVFLQCLKAQSSNDIENFINPYKQALVSNNLSTKDDECPPCFNCMLPMFNCKQFSQCNEFNGQCECMEGFGGPDCSKPLCGGLNSDNEKRPLRNNTLNNDTFTEQCVCDDGWDGINCNLCIDDDVCKNFFDDEELKKGAVCNQNGIIVKKLYQACDVTNPKIIELLPKQKPQVSFHCDKLAEECYFQFWTNQVESFYCGFDTCAFDFDLNKNISHYKCENAECKCIAGEFLCGKSGFIDISEFLEETIKGPGEFTCDLNTKECKFTEPSINDLITTLFGDPYISLKCNGGECMHYSQIPGYSQPAKNILTWKQIFGLLVFVLAVGALIAAAVDFISKSPMFKNNDYKQLPVDEDEEFERFINLDKPGVTLTFEDIKYCVGKKNTKILKGISGHIVPGLTAIMGPSGGGKSTLIDILSNKQKSGKILGSVKINGESLINTSNFKLLKSIGFVDQDNFFLPTLTVYETILNSALLRLPKNMKYDTKVKFVIKVLKDLRIYDIKDNLIGNEFERGISGGERKRVAIGCELVKSPSILFLDEPTSGLDSANSKNVVDCLSDLAFKNNTTVVCSIHQPRANVFAKFDSLVFLGKGEMYFSGPVSELKDFLTNCGYECPSNVNIADYLLDITFDEHLKPLTQSFMEGHSYKNNNLGEISHLLCSPEEEAEHNYSSILGSQAELLSRNTIGNHELAEKFINSQVYASLLYQIKNSNSVESLNMNLNLYSSQASWIEQVIILSSRTFKNVYRNPKLLIGNYFLTIIVSIFLGTLYYNVQNDLTGFQNRMGLFFFLILFLGFLAFTGLSTFYLERVIFLKERSNNYYHPSAYYVSKIISDIVPLRLIPPILLSVIVYPLVGLNMGDGQPIYFFKFLTILILFNFAISFEILTVGIFFQDLNAAIMFTVLLLLWSVLFSGLFINTAHITNDLFKYMKNGSLFFFSYEALIINEVKDLTLKDEKLGLTIEVPGATILSTVGFNALNLNRDIGLLFAYILFFLTLGYLLLHYRVIERK